MLTDSRWDDSREESYLELQKPLPGEARTALADEFRRGASEAALRFAKDPFAQIEHGRFKLRRDDLKKPTESHLQKTISASLPLIRVEQLLMEVDQATGFTRSFVPLQGHRSRPRQYYKSLLAAIISQATNLGVVSMSASVPGVTLGGLLQVASPKTRLHRLSTGDSS